MTAASRAAGQSRRPGTGASPTRQQVIDALRDQAPERIQAWAIEIDGRRFPLAQAWACATNQPRSVYTTSKARNVFERLGLQPFHIRQPRTHRSMGHDDVGVVAPLVPAPVQRGAPPPQGTDLDRVTLLERLRTVTAERDWLRERVERAEFVCEQLRTLLSDTRQSSPVRRKRHHSRRPHPEHPETSGLTPGPLQVVGSLTIDRSRCTATVGGDPIHLTPTEYRLLDALADPPNRVHLSMDLAQRVWDDPSLANIHSLHTHMRRIRSKLKAGPLGPPKLVTVRGIGYLLETPSHPRRSQPALDA